MKKLFSILRWVGVMLGNLMFFLSAHVVYPLLYPFRNTFIRNIKPFWWFFDDEDGDYGTPWFRESLKFGEMKNWWQKFKVAYLWSADRNAAWNLQASLVPVDGEKKLQSHTGRAYRNGEKVGIYVFPSFKWVDKDGKYKNNKGEFLSLKYSTIGKQGSWYRVGSKLYFRYGYAQELVKGHFVEFHIGISNDRYTWRLKWKWDVKISPVVLSFQTTWM